MARVVLEEARFRAGMLGDPKDLVALASAFSAQGNSSGEAHARALASLRFLETGDLAAAEESLDTIAADESIHTDLPVRLLVAVAKAELLLAKGDSEMATEVLEKAADLVDGHRILLSATEARAGVSLLADEIAGLGRRAIHEDGRSAISWTERFRGASLRIAPVVMTPDTELGDQPGRAAGARPRDRRAHPRR